MTASPGAEELVTVVLRGLPVAVHARASEHGQELQREFTLLHLQLERQAAAGDAVRSAEGDVPRRLVELVEALQGRYAGYTTEQEDQLEAAIEQGVDSLDLTFRVPPDAAAASVDLGEMLDEADAYCREGRHLLTLATPPEALAYRQWYLQQFVDQIAGRPGQSWREWLLARPPASDPVDPPAESGG
jgi:hypothetical protein